MSAAMERPSESKTRPVLNPEALPDRFANIEELEEFLTTPSQALIDDLAMVDGDILVLGAGGKMGPTLAGLAKRAGEVLLTFFMTEPPSAAFAPAPGFALMSPA